jgi:NACHT domain- and WD repeat-containing protein
MMTRAGTKPWKELLDSLEESARTRGIDLDGRYLALGTSATEQEIAEGALSVSDAAEHVHAFFRTLKDLPVNLRDRNFVDLLPNGTHDAVSKSRLESLRSRIETSIGEANIHPYTLVWRDGGFEATGLENFGRDAYGSLEDVILREIQKLASTSLEDQEGEAHRTFEEERCHRFVGRSEPLRAIATSLDHPGGLSAVVGLPGVGKSTLMAEAAHRARLVHGAEAVIARFIGATAASTNIVSLLTDIVTEIRRRYPQVKEDEVPFDMRPLVDAFHEGMLRATRDRPLFIFLDGLDLLGRHDDALKLYLFTALNSNKMGTSNKGLDKSPGFV